ncbi:MAG TPA: RDD family protein [Thermoanaerobaculia bacterium]|nr:RDD family protein [Thermoanaerobaculia bacterium]
MYCPQCGVNNDRGESNCYICGAALPSLAAATSAAGGRGKAAAGSERQATVGDRALALIFDRILLGTILMIFASWYTSGAGRLDPNATSEAIYGLAAAIGLMFLYHVILEGAAGTTLGKAMMALHVRSVDGRPLFLAALIRNALRIVDSVGFYLLGFLFAMFTQRGQRVGDLVAGTVVMERAANPKIRAGLMVLWLLLVGAAVWFAWALCPTCRVMLPR